MRTRTHTSRRDAESGVTLIELLIAMVVLTIGLVALAQLFIVAALNNSFAVTTSGAVNDAQRLVEAWKVKAAVGGIAHPDITSATYDTGTEQSAAFAQLTGYYAKPSRFKENVWVYDWTGTRVGSASPADPPGVASGTLRSSSLDSRLVYILMEPKVDDPRTIQPVILTAIVTAD